MASKIIITIIVIKDWSFLVEHTSRPPPPKGKDTKTKDRGRTPKLKTGAGNQN